MTSCSARCWGTRDVRCPVTRRRGNHTRGVGWLDSGAAVSVFTVAREMGYGGDALVKRAYGHLGQVRHRADAVEYRVEQHVERLGKRLTALHARVCQRRCQRHDNAG